MDNIWQKLQHTKWQESNKNVEDILFLCDNQAVNFNVVAQTLNIDVFTALRHKVSFLAAK